MKQQNHKIDRLYQRPTLMESLIAWALKVYQVIARKRTLEVWGKEDNDV